MQMPSAALVTVTKMVTGYLRTALRPVRRDPMAAGQGNADAQFAVGRSYALGQGVPQDYSEAVRWCQKAAEQGNANAQVCLGFSYYEGQGIPRIVQRR